MNLIRRSRRDAVEAEVLEKRVMTASRRLERLLRNRFEVQPVGASERIAARTWDVRLLPLLKARAQRLLASDGTPPTAWFTDWVETASALVLTTASLPAEDAVGADSSAVPDPLLRIPLLGLWGLTVATATIGVLSSPVSVGLLATADWKFIGSVVAVVVGAATCVNFAVGWFRRTSGRIG
ncbi:MULTISPECIES: hypothetical protein [Curtobacterium]|uniref:hypothetical protein n=1 Tax=Curtobacterium TaxID=2034 RepID=UPI001113F24F|nr:MULTISPECIES: hypothetical protein [Curtobacterium]